MKVVVAIDSLKGSLTSLEAGNAAKEGILRIMPEAEVVVKPLADGGEGTTDALIEGMGGRRITLTVTGPMGQKTESSYGILEDGITAVMEMAQAAGITKVPENVRNPLKATTAGVGEMIKDAIDRGCRRFLIGIGGSATNDGGMGMLKVLGCRFVDANGQDVGEGAEALSKVVMVKADKLLPELAECDFQIACDVTSPLCGAYGATCIYGPQKGLPLELCSEIDKGMEQYADAVEKFTGAGKRYRNIPGAGAAGGLGFAFITFLHGELKPGVDLILDVTHIDKELRDAQYVVTGEGRLDAQTVMGKAPIGVAKRAKLYGCKVLAFAGSVAEDAGACNKEGVDAFFSIIQGATTLKEAMEPENARRNMTAAVEQVFRVINI